MVYLPPLQMRDRIIKFVVAVMMAAIVFMLVEAEKFRNYRSSMVSCERWEDKVCGLFECQCVTNGHMALKMAVEKICQDFNGRIMSIEVTHKKCELCNQPDYCDCLAREFTPFPC